MGLLAAMLGLLGCDILAELEEGVATSRRAGALASLKGLDAADVASVPQSRPAAAPTPAPSNTASHQTA
jgi:hypothetical protein